MEHDSLVAEVRKIREAYAKRFNYDLDAIARDLKRIEQTCGLPVVSFAPRRPRRVPRTAKKK